MHHLELITGTIVLTIAIITIVAQEVDLAEIEVTPPGQRDGRSHPLGAR